MSRGDQFRPDGQAQASCLPFWGLLPLHMVLLSFLSVSIWHLPGKLSSPVGWHLGQPGRGAGFLLDSTRVGGGEKGSTSPPRDQEEAGGMSQCYPWGLMSCSLDKHPRYLLSWISMKIKWKIYIKFLEASLEHSTQQMFITIIVTVLAVDALLIRVFS